MNSAPSIVCCKLDRAASPREETARWMELASKCCPLLVFGLEDCAAGMWRTLTGPQGTREFLAAEMELHD